jgi:hypothetical protein
MNNRQLVFFPPSPSEDMEELRISFEKVRKGVFHRTSKQDAKINALEEKIALLEQHIWMLEGLLKKSA